jgi:tetratricopeptide (TPR) repeat protein
MTLANGHPLPPTLSTGDPLYERDGYLGILNIEALEGARAADELVNADVGARERLLRENPSWVRVGTFRAVLDHARLAFDSNASFALELTSFVLAHVDDVKAPSPDSAFLVDLLRGVAWKEYANALYMLDRFDDAHRAARRAIELLEADPFFVAYRAAARVLVAMIVLSLGQTDEAISILDDAMEVLADHDDAAGLLVALQVRALIALDRREYDYAKALFETALAHARRLRDEREQARIRHNLALCMMRMDDLAAAYDYMTEAFDGFSRLKMHGELQRAIWLTAELERQRGNYDAALGALHTVYGRFLERGMVTEAAGVLIELGNVVTELTGKTEDAQEMCAKLAVTLGRYDVPARVREVIERLRTESAAAKTAAALRAVLKKAGELLRDASPSAAPEPTLTDQ